MGTLAAKVIYDPFALGDRSYNNLTYQGVEEAAARHGLRTMQQSPLSYEEGLAYLQTMFPAYPGFARLPFECSPVREPVPQRTRRIYTLP